MALIDSTLKIERKSGQFSANLQTHQRAIYVARFFFNTDKEESMTPNQLFTKIRTDEYKKIGEDVDYKVETIHEEKAVYLMFKGSNSGKDWKLNFSFGEEVYENQQNKLFAHKGFIKAWKSANDTIMEEYINACNENPDYTPIICGHSLGGALSQLAMEDFCFRTSRKPVVITFGSPNVWSKKSDMDYLKGCYESILQYAHNNDVVTKVPPFYLPLNKIPVGNRFCPIKMFRINYYHCQSYAYIDYTKL